jgi:hypothetical protein
LTRHEETAIASVKLQDNISEINESTRISFTVNNQTCPTVQLAIVALSPQNKEVKHLGMLLDRRLTLTKLIKGRRKQLNLKAKQMH